jgi:polyphosphate glucokinase
MIEDLVLGIDVGASAVKGAIVDMKTGELVSERIKVPSTSPFTVTEMANAVNEIKSKSKYRGTLMGVGFPAVVKSGVSLTAANIHKDWIGQNVEKIFSEATGLSTFVLNDADAAGIAEMLYGAGQSESGTVLLLTIGTGIGSALFVNGRLVPNTEFGHIYLKDSSIVAEKFTSTKARESEELSWKDFGGRLNKYLKHIDRTLNPDVIILGGGDSKRFSNYEKYLEIKTRVIPAQHLNAAGIVGAAYYAYEKSSE